MVAFSDGEYAKFEEVGLVIGLLEKDAPAGIAKADLEAAIPEMESSIRRDYDATAKRVLEMISSLKGNGVAKRSIMHAVRAAIMADRAIRPQEENAAGRISEALGLKEGEL